MDPVLLVGIISGGSAIVASVGAQIISAAVTARQQTKRFNWEREHAAEQANAERSSLHYQQNLKTFVMIQDLLFDGALLLTAAAHAPNEAAIEHLHDDGSARLPTYRELAHKFTAQAHLTQLIAPSVSVVLWRILPVIDEFEASSANDRPAVAKRYVDLRIDALNAMRRVLNVASLESSPHTQPQLNEARKSGDSSKPGPTT